MKSDTFFHYFRNHEATIYIQHIGQQLINPDTLLINFTFVMNFDNKNYIFCGYSNELEYIPCNKIDKIRYILLNKERKVICEGIYNNLIELDLKLTPDELSFLDNSIN